jgi:hypothetical protein
MARNATQGRGFTPLSVLSILLLSAALGSRSAGAAQRKLPAIKLTYRGGPLIQRVKVATLFWGSSWNSSSLPSYFNSFFRNLFADGRFMANLAQYSAGGYTIGNGSFVATDIDTQNPPARVKDAQIQAEIRARVVAKRLPQADEDIVYFVFTPPGVVVVDGNGDNSADDFVSYHDFHFGGSGYAYAVMPFDDSLRDPRWMTLNASHELAEAVTDPAPYDGSLGWYDDYYGEVADIPDVLYDAYVIDDADYVDELDAPDGSYYLVQKVWSLKDNAPVAFAS